MGVPNCVVSRHQKLREKIREKNSGTPKNSKTGHPQTSVAKSLLIGDEYMGVPNSVPTLIGAGKILGHPKIPKQDTHKPALPSP